MPRGGKRPGAGAPKGNLNALKSGRRSKQLKIVIEFLLASPAIRRVMLRLVKEDIRRNRQLRQAITAIGRPYRRRSITQTANPQNRQPHKNARQSNSAP